MFSLKVSQNISHDDEHTYLCIGKFMDKNTNDILLIRDGIKEYSRAYARLEKLQKAPNQLLPRVADQKTGAIGEFYVSQYLKKEYPKATIEFIKTAGNNDKAKKRLADIADIKVSHKDGREILVQVKTVSAYANNRRTSKVKFRELALNKAHLYLITLDVNFQPEGLWIIENIPEQFAKKEGGSITMPEPGNYHGTGTIDLVDWEHDRILFDRIKLNLTG